MSFVDLFAEQMRASSSPRDILTEGVVDIPATSSVYRLGFRAGPVDGFEQGLRIGHVELHYVPGPVLTQRTEIRQRAGIELVFDKHMARGVEVGGGHWLTVAQIAGDVPGDPAQHLLRCRPEAEAAIGLLASVLDERVALEEVFEDLIYLGDEGPLTAGDMRSRLRHFLPYRVTDTERTTLKDLDDVPVDETSAAGRAARWYLRAAQQGPTPNAIVELWVAIETLTPGDRQSPKATVAALTQAGWDVTSQELSVGQLAGLRADIVHKGVDDAALITKGYYHLEAIARVLIRDAVRASSSWPAQTETNWLVAPPAAEVDEDRANPETVWHLEGLPTAEPAPSMGETHWHPPLVAPEDTDPPDVLLEGATEETGPRISFWVKQAARNLDCADAEGLAVHVTTDLAGDMATNADRVVINAALLDDPDLLREIRLGWLLQAGVAQQLLMAKGVRSEGGLGSLLIEVFGSWAQYREFVAGDGPYDDGDLVATEPAPSGDLITVAGHLGAALAGSAQANSIVARWLAVTTDQHLAELVTGLRASLAPVTEPRELLELLAAAYSNRDDE